MWTSASLADMAASLLGQQRAHHPHNVTLVVTALSVVHRIVTLLCLLGKGAEDLDDKDLEPLRRWFWVFSKPLLLLALSGTLPNSATVAWGGAFARIFPLGKLLAISVMFVCYVFDQESDESPFVLTE